MIARGRRYGAWFLLLTIAVGVALVLEPGRKALIFQLYALAIGALLLTALVRAASRRFGRVERSPFEAALRAEPPADLVPEELERLRRHVALARSSAYDLHFRLRPALVEIAEARLWQRGIDLAREPDRARAALGDELYELVRPDREPPRDSRAPGPPLAELENAVEMLARI